MRTAKQERLRTLDIMRSAALVSMVAFHLCYDLDAFYGAHILTGMGGTADVWARSTAAVFLGLSGIGIALSRQRAQRRGTSATAWYRRIARRGAGLLCCGAIISAITYAVEPETFVRFGILHCIGAGFLLLAPLAGRPRAAAMAAVIASGLWYLTRTVAPAGAWGIPLGMPPSMFASVDYYPLLPWIACMALGIACAEPVARGAATIDRLPLLRTKAAACAALPGQWSLAVYLLHQPVLLALLALLLGLPR